jgi:hypothetical protein
MHRLLPAAGAELERYDRPALSMALATRAPSRAPVHPALVRRLVRHRCPR